LRHLDPAKLERPFPQQTIAAAAEYGDDENDDEESEREEEAEGLGQIANGVDCSSSSTCTGPIKFRKIQFYD
jgi:hypothetical protein